MKTILVAGVIANKLGSGGAVWTRLSWANGFQQLGYRVVFAEQIDAARCVDADGRPAPFEASANLAYFHDVTRRHGLADASLACGDAIDGLPLATLVDVAADAEWVVNISGHLTLPGVLQAARGRCVYVDLDPGYTQHWHANGQAARLEGHDHFVTVGRNVGTDRSMIPTGGVRWLPVWQPVVLADWPCVPPPAAPRFTTVASWRGPFGQVEVDGQSLGPKAREFRKLIALPRALPSIPMELALEIHPGDAADLASLRAHGWSVVDPVAVAGTPESFRTYVQGSAAELSVAQGMYVHTNGGWFSDRTVRYLASGRPAVVQETGFSAHLPTGAGLLPFTTPADAAVAVAEVAARPAEHAQAARAIAERYFAADRVLGDLLEQLRRADGRHGSSQGNR